MKIMQKYLMSILQLSSNIETSRKASKGRNKKGGLITWISPARRLFYYLFSRILSSFPTLKKGSFLEITPTFSPVRGLRPVYPL